MGFKVVYTKSFNGYLRDLQERGQKKVVQAIRAAMQEAGVDGEIRSIPRTKHGEARIPDVEKYDLSDGYRLVVQLVDGVARTRAFLFAGSHDASGRWLDAHQNYRWVKSRADGTLEFVQVTERKEERHVPADRVDLESAEDALALPLLRVLSPTEWQRLKLPDPARQLVGAVSGSDYERDADGILERLDELLGWEKASLVFDLMCHAHAREWSEFHRRFDVAIGNSIVAAPAEVAPAMLAPENSESFIAVDDVEGLDRFFKEHSLADWMLFLHPEQKKVAEKDFRGPTRLRGVSGSGKTCVLVHRARYLAKKYRQPVLLLTLTESMRKLLEQLADDLCGVERGLVTAMTMSAAAKQVVQELHPRRSAFYTVVSQDRQDRLLSTAADRVRAHADVRLTPFQSMSAERLDDFLRDEIVYVRSRLRSSEMDRYTDTKAFKRRGRGLALDETARRVVLAGVGFYEEELTKGHLLDHEGIVRTALDQIDGGERRFDRFRCVLCDEVQDLSQLEMALIGKFSTPSGDLMATAENGLFLAGDGAQTIYKRGFTLRNLGIDVSSRSFTLRKNYRNTHEILKAAFGLVAQFEFADVDEDNIAKPSEPEFAKRHGARPVIARCDSPTEEASAVASSVSTLLRMGHTAGQICIVGPSVKLREEVKDALSQLKVQHVDLRQDVDYGSDRVKISTIESAKGHEFGAVFIMGLVEGVLPNAGSAPEDISREAARLYVAMTRARENLTITYSPTAGYPVSRFLLPIQSDCDEAHYRAGRMDRLQS